MKHCKDCDNDLPVTSFSKNKKSADGLYTYCKECASARKRKYRASPETKRKERDYSKKWTEDNREHIRRYSRANYFKVAEKNAARLKKWSAENREKLLEGKKRYYQENYQKCRQNMKYRHERMRDNLAAYYVAACICQGTNLKPSDIPAPLIEAKRTTILIKRLIKEQL